MSSGFAVLGGPLAKPSGWVGAGSMAPVLLRRLLAAVLWVAQVQD